MLSLSKISTNGKFMFLAYDHGLEHGPSDFNDINIDPNYILDIADKAKFNAVILQKGIAEKYYVPFRKKVSLIIKLNGKTSFVEDEPYSAPLCTVDEAIKLKACAVGYTVYVGSKFESLMFKEFGNVVREAHNKNIPVIAWMYPRGKAVKGKEDSPKVLAYAARAGLELGADILKMHYAGSVQDMRRVVESAGRAKVVISGGLKTNEREFLKDIKDAIKAGCSGVAVGRNVWQAKEPLGLSKEICRIISEW